MDEDVTPPTLEVWNDDALAVAAEKVKALRALFANQIFIQPDGLHLRMSFGEMVGGDPLFHTAFVVPNGDALAFGQLMVSMAQKSIDQQVEAMKQAIAASPVAEENGK